MRVGVDTGGTFTDVVDETGALVKVLSTRGRSRGSGASAGVAPGRVAADVLAHGTTVATNTLLERRGARRRAVDQRGLRGPHRDRAGRTARRSTTSGPTDLNRSWPVRCGSTVPGRIAADGTELVALDVTRLPVDPRRSRDRGGVLPPRRSMA